MEGWLATVPAALFVSHRRLARRRSLPRRWPGAAWALDSGGFTELSQYGGWRVGPQEYVAAVARYDREIGHLDFAAPQDWMCEPAVVARTGLSELEHQRRTVANFVELERLWPLSGADNESPFVPVLQGQAVESYLRCWDMYGEAGVDVSAYPLVGLGSVCRRQHSGEIREVIEALLDRDPGLPIHGFGVKARGIAEYGWLLESFDSLAWSYNARRNPRLAGCTHVSCSNCLRWALRWRRNLVAGGCPDHGELCDGTIRSCRLIERHGPAAGLVGAH